MQLKNIIGITGIIVVIVILIIICIAIFIYLRLIRDDPKSYKKLEDSKYTTVDPMYYQGLLLKTAFSYLLSYFRMNDMTEYERMIEMNNSSRYKFTNDEIHEKFSELDGLLNHKKKKAIAYVDVDRYKNYLDAYCKCLAPLAVKSGNIDQMNKEYDIYLMGVINEIHNVMGDKSAEFLKNNKYVIPANVFEMSKEEADRILVDAAELDRAAFRRL